MSNGLIGTALLGLPELTENGSPAVVTGNVYWGVLVDGEGECMVGVAERVGDCGTSRGIAAVSFMVGDLCAGRSL